MPSAQQMALPVWAGTSRSVGDLNRTKGRGRRNSGFFFLPHHLSWDMSPHLLPSDWELYLVLRLSDSDGVIPLSFFSVQLVDGRSWDLSAPITVTPSCSCGKRNIYSLPLDCPNTPMYHAWCLWLTRSGYAVVHITNFIACILFPILASHPFRERGNYPRISNESI